MSDAIILAVSAIGFLAICAVILRVGDWMTIGEDDD